MTRIATALTCLSAFSLCVPLSANDAAIETLKARIAALEGRLSVLEQAVDLSPGSSSYPSPVLAEATNAGGAGSDESFTYLIKEGDTLGSIAQKHGVERSSLLELNRLSEGQPIYIGETLLIPGTRPGASPGDEKRPETANETTVVVGNTRDEGADGAPAPTGGTKSHTVGRGDTLTNIAARYGTTVAALKSANGLKSDTINLGQRINVPGSGGAAPAGSQTASYEYSNPLLRNDETYGSYTVQKGDNLYALARDFFTTMAELQRLNELGDSTVIHPGDDLIVPTSKYNAHHNSGMAQR